MKLAIALILAILSVNSFALFGNLVLRINDRNANDNIQNIYLLFKYKKHEEQIQLIYKKDQKAWYLDGKYSDLISHDDWDKKYIMKIECKNTINDTSQIVMYEVNLTRLELCMFQHIDIYDFREEQYKNKYQNLTDKDYFTKVQCVE